MKNFNMVDDEKCAIFELGILILKISLLETNSSPTLLFDQRPILQTLAKAKEVYA